MPLRLGNIFNNKSIRKSNKNNAQKVKEAPASAKSVNSNFPKNSVDNKGLKEDLYVRREPRFKNASVNKPVKEIKKTTSLTLEKGLSPEEIKRVMAAFNGEEAQNPIKEEPDLKKVLEFNSGEQAKKTGNVVSKIAADDLIEELSRDPKKEKFTFTNHYDPTVDDKAMELYKELNELEENKKATSADAAQKPETEIKKKQTAATITQEAAKKEVPETEIKQKVSGAATGGTSAIADDAKDISEQLQGTPKETEGTASELTQEVKKASQGMSKPMKAALAIGAAAIVAVGGYIVYNKHKQKAETDKQDETA